MFPRLKIILLTAKLLFLDLASASRAVPKLRIHLPGSTYDFSTESWTITTHDSFTEFRAITTHDYDHSVDSRTGHYGPFGKWADWIGGVWTKVIP